MYTTTLSDVRDKLYLLMKAKYDADTNERISGVSDNVYMDTLPTTMSSSITDCVMLDFESNIKYSNAFASGTLRVWLLIPTNVSESYLSKLNLAYINAIEQHKLSKDAGIIEFNHRYEYVTYDSDRKLRGFVKELKVKIK